MEFSEPQAIKHMDGILRRETYHLSLHFAGQTKKLQIYCKLFLWDRELSPYGGTRQCKLSRRCIVEFAFKVCGG